MNFLNLMCIWTAENLVMMYAYMKYVHPKIQVTILLSVLHLGHFQTLTRSFNSRSQLGCLAVWGITEKRRITFKGGKDCQVVCKHSYSLGSMQLWREPVIKCPTCRLKN